MRVGIIFHKDPFAAPSGIDLVRLRALSGGLIDRGIAAEIVSPVNRHGRLDDKIPVVPLDALKEKGRYDVVKTSYHFSMELIDEYDGPVISRIVRVVDEKLPERDEPFRERLLACQEKIQRRSSVLILNNIENEQRWRELYGPEPRIVHIPNGCPDEIPPPGPNPYADDRPAVLFLGSIAAPRMLRMINAAAELLADRARVHLVGLNKVCMYGGTEEWCELHPSVLDHGEIPEPRTWDYIYHAAMGLAFATGPYPFDNDVSKVYNYLRGGLPTLSEEPILENALIRETDHGAVFPLNDTNRMFQQALALLDTELTEQKTLVRHMLRLYHGWDDRVQRLSFVLGRFATTKVWSPRSKS